MPRRWIAITMITTATAVAAATVCLTVLSRPNTAAAQSQPAPRFLQLGPATQTTDEAVRPATDASGRRILMRVCADPNNLPFSNRAGEGFENELAKLLAQDLGLRVAYYWWPQRRGFVRNSLKLGDCDVIMGISAESELVLATRPYYRSTYVFLTRRDGPVVRSLDDTVLRHLKIGIPLTGGEANPPPAQSLAERGLASRVEGYPLYGDYSKPNPPSALVDAVSKRDVDVAVVWGPFAGYFARFSHAPLTIAPVEPARDRNGLPYTYAISLGVRRGDRPWRDQLQTALDRHQTQIRRLLERYGVPLVGGDGR
jgi:mxaJ protein